jgi:hypothetical protein
MSEVGASAPAVSSGVFGYGCRAAVSVLPVDEWTGAVGRILYGR